MASESAQDHLRAASVLLTTRLSVAMGGQRAVCDDLRRRTKIRVPSSTVGGWIRRGNPPRPAGGLSSADAEEMASALCDLVGLHLGAEEEAELRSLWARWTATARADRRRGARDRGAEYREGRPPTHSRYERLDDLDELLDRPAQVVAHVDLAEFRMASALAGGEVAAYVDRDIDPTLDRCINAAFLSPRSASWEGRFVVVAGGPKTGKTRSLLEGIRRARPEATLLSVGGALPTLSPLSVFGDRLAAALPAITPPRVVLVEDLDQHLAHVQVEPTIRRIIECEETIVLATTSSSSLHADLQDPSDSHYRQRDLLKRRAIELPENLSAAEQLRAATVYSTSIADGQLSLEDLSSLPELAASMDRLLERAQAALGSNQYPGRRALVTAALDVAAANRAGSGEARLNELALLHLRHRFARTHTVEAHTAELRDANQWIRQPLGAAYALLTPHYLGTATRWELPEFVAARLLDEHDTATYLVDLFEPWDALELGRHAEKSRRVLIGDESPQAVTQRQRSLDASAYWYRTALDGLTGVEGFQTMVADCRVRLARVLLNAGLEEEGTELLMSEVAGGNPDAAWLLAMRLWTTGDIEGAETAIRHHAEAGHRRCQELMVSLRPRGDSQRQYWLRVLAHDGDAWAYAPLAVELLAEGQRTKAREWLERGAEASDVDCIVILAVVHVARGRPDEADRAWQQLERLPAGQLICFPYAATDLPEWRLALDMLVTQRERDPDDPETAFRLGLLLTSEFSGGEQELRSAADQGHHHARLLLNWRDLL